MQNIEWIDNANLELETQFKLRTKNNQTYSETDRLFIKYSTIKPDYYIDGPTEDNHTQEHIHEARILKFDQKVWPETKPELIMWLGQRRHEVYFDKRVKKWYFQNLHTYPYGFDITAYATVPLN